MHPSSWIVPIPISPSIPGQQGLDPMSGIGSCLHIGIQNLLGSKTMEPNTWDVLGEWWLSPGSASQISIGRSDSFSMCQRCLPTPESGNARKIKYSFLLAFPVTPFCSRAFSQGSGDSWRWRNRGTTGFSWDPVASSRNGGWFFLLDIILDILFLKTQQSNQGGLNPYFSENPTRIRVSRVGCTHPDPSTTGFSQKFARYL